MSPLQLLRHHVTGAIERGESVAIVAMTEDQIERRVEPMTTQYRIRYEYVNPSPAGPCRGSMVSANKQAKGDIVCAVMGRAEVTSCRAVTPPTPEALSHHFSTVAGCL